MRRRFVPTRRVRHPADLGRPGRGTFRPVAAPHPWRSTMRTARPTRLAAALGAGVLLTGVGATPA
ncbi:hypothetical protein F8198_11105, partial [Micrococcus luteus NCTC 2665]